MRHSKKRLFAIVALALILLLFYAVLGNPFIRWRNARLRKAILALEPGTVTLEQSIPFAWDAVYTFDPYTSLEQIQAAVGSRSGALAESVNEGMTHVVFVKGGAVVASVCRYPQSLGYMLTFFNENSTAGVHTIAYGENVLFNVNKSDGITVLSMA